MAAPLYRIPGQPAAPSEAPPPRGGTAPVSAEFSGAARTMSAVLAQQNYRFGAGAREALGEYLVHRIPQPHFANARSVRNALDRARLRNRRDNPAHLKEFSSCT